MSEVSQNEDAPDLIFPPRRNRHENSREHAIAREFTWRCLSVPSRDLVIVPSTASSWKIWGTSGNQYCSSRTAVDRLIVALDLYRAYELTYSRHSSFRCDLQNLDPPSLFSSTSDLHISLSFARQAHPEHVWSQTIIITVAVQ